MNTRKTEDTKAFGTAFMLLADDPAAQDKVLGALFRALAFGIQGDKADKPA